MKTFSHDLTDVIANLEKDYGIVDRLAEPTLPVKYPRTPGHRPSQTENPLNAWYVKGHKSPDMICTRMNSLTIVE